MKLHKFNSNVKEKELHIKQNKRKYIKRLTISLSVFVIVLGVIYFSFAKFNADATFNVVNSTVGEFVTGDANVVAIYVDNVKTQSVPGKTEGYIIDRVECTNGATADWNGDKWLLETTLTEPTKCTLYFKKSSFITSSWSDIVAAYNNGDTGDLEKSMLAGTTRDIDLGELGVHKLRIANLTKCSDVRIDEDGHSACGLVIEFADIITTREMNSTNTNVGGWESSEMRTYVNNDIYNLLPSELKNLIIDTSLYSGAGKVDVSNGIKYFKTIDKLYLLARREVWNHTESVDTASTAGDSGLAATRQLDYYERIGVTTNRWEKAKKYNGEYSMNWWLRTARSDSNYVFYYVHSTDGGSIHSASDVPRGVSPAFRLAE